MHLYTIINSLEIVYYYSVLTFATLYLPLSKKEMETSYLSFITTSILKFNIDFSYSSSICILCSCFTFSSFLSFFFPSSSLFCNKELHLLAEYFTTLSLYHSCFSILFRCAMNKVLSSLFMGLQIMRFTFSQREAAWVQGQQQTV